MGTEEELHDKGQKIFSIKSEEKGPSLGKMMPIQIQETQRTPDRHGSKFPTSYDYIEQRQHGESCEGEGLSPTQS